MSTPITINEIDRLAGKLRDRGNKVSADTTVLMMRVNSGDADAVVTCSFWAMEAGEPALAREWIYALAQGGNEQAIVGMSVIEEAVGNDLAAVQWNLKLAALPIPRGAFAPDSRPVNAMYSLGNLYEKAGDFKTAHTWFKKAAKYDGVYAKARLKAIEEAHPEVRGSWWSR